MCQFWSCIIDRHLKVHYDGNDSNHEEIIKKAGLTDNKLIDRDFVRIEITPSKLTMNPKDWTLKVDEEKTLPEWFTKNREQADKNCYKTLFAYLKVCHIAEVNKFIDSFKKVRWFKPDGKPRKEWKIFYGKTWDAARDAARDAAWDAAWDAARDAAWDAARDAALLTRFIVITDKIPQDKNLQKHYKHAKERWEVWTKGYGLYCDVNGVLYVYGVKK
jgi:hypothetical protein